MGVLEVGVLVRHELGGSGSGSDDDLKISLAYGLRHQPGRGGAGASVQQVAGGSGDGEHHHGGQVVAQPGGDVGTGEHGGQHAGGGRERRRGEHGSTDLAPEQGHNGATVGVPAEPGLGRGCMGDGAPSPTWTG
ncbi:hypothetical protein [Streptomyces sp. NPDC054765]